MKKPDQLFVVHDGRHITRLTTRQHTVTFSNMGGCDLKLVLTNPGPTSYVVATFARRSRRLLFWTSERFCCQRVTVYRRASEAVESLNGKPEDPTLRHF